MDNGDKKPKKSPINGQPVPSNPSGRPKGVLNKHTAAVKEAFKIAFDEMGGAEALCAWGRENQTDFYKLVSKLIPTEITGDEKNPIVIKDVTDIKSKLLKAIPEDELNRILAGDNNGGPVG